MLTMYTDMKSAWVNVKLPIQHLPLDYWGTLHFFSRHPRALPKATRPLDPLEKNTWIATFGTLLALTLSILTIYRLFKPYAELTRHRREMWSAVKVITRSLKAGNAIWLLTEFLAFIFIFLYGIDLRTALISQKFEKTVDSWEDIDLFLSNIRGLLSDGACLLMNIILNY